jgi:hypothetical protein
MLAPEVHPDFLVPDYMSSNSSYDSQRQLMVVHGHYDPNSNATWTLSLGGTPAYNLLNRGTNSVPQGDNVQIYDPVRDRTLIFGGIANYPSPVRVNTVWKLPGGTTTWSQVTTAGTPPYPRDGAAGIYDPVGDRMIVFGGFNPDFFNPYLDELWALSLSGTPTWTQLFPAGTPPPGRRDHIAVWDAPRQRMLIFGGRTAAGNPGLANDVWALNLAGPPQWQQLSPAGTPPTGRTDPAGAYIPSQDALVIYGGLGTSTNDGWRLLLGGTPTWGAITPTNVPPAGAGSWTGVSDPVHIRLVMYGARCGGSEGWAIDWNPSVVTTGVEPTVSRGQLRLAAATSLARPGREIVVQFVLPNRTPATLRVFDLAGRMVASRDVTALGPGQHELALPEIARRSAGVYLIRLDQDGRSAGTKAVLLH